MIANVSAHRRANAFAQALEEQSDPGAAAEQSGGPAAAGPAGEPTEQGRLLTLATGLETLPRPELDPEVKVVQRAQLVAAFEAMLQEGTVGGAADPAVPEQRRARGTHRAAPLSRFRPRSRLAKGLTAGGLSVSVAAGAFGGVAAASSDALPGDSLYGLKRGIEDFRLGLADGDDERGRAYLDLASTRLSEARRLMERGRSGPLDHESLTEIRRALSGMRHDASEGHRLLSAVYARDPDSIAPMQALSAFSRSHRESWGALRDRLPVQLGDVSEQVSSVFDAIEDDVAPLQSLLPTPPDQETGGTEDSRPGSSESATRNTPGSGHSSAPSTGDGGTSERGRTDSGRPSESTDTGQENDGLLGGGTGGLLDPPKDSSPASPSTGGNTPPAEPDVTLPPLLPGLLPGLGIEADDAE
ncbi:DUF5667 domain-containing protein [Streptomyces rochei]|uniref:DUF5667 domain-containing protein n=1 Tax=Streptomyces plicatus TaxID=1922 RepID=A0ABW1XZN6_STRPL|nr:MULTISPECIES: DUF5667 domain-containing protein [Streptomyces]KYK17249.1 hypothetical protein AUW26_12750 [Streptomyces sp. CC71]WMI58040.1 DUF5667 domain-containing protein [Streptomyces rochei]GGZ39273.1 hypothetical protein GCM10010301_09340 [Streptomyces plicatus]GHC17073.1 hypothetical protein GCM10010308_35910 [Streptomyces vinaceusdrappus]